MGRYQVILLLISLPFNVLCAYAFFTPILVLYVPDHHCSINAHLNNNNGGNFTREQLEGWFIPMEEGSMSKSRMYNRTLVRIPSLEIITKSDHPHQLLSLIPI